MAEGHALAQTLVGLTRQAAVDRVLDEGFLAQVVEPTANDVFASLNENRIMLVVDADNRVASAHVG